MYYSKGWSPTEIGDMCLIAHEDRLHLFHLCLPSHDTIAHLVSDDGVTWQRLPNALHVGEPGSFDDDQLWTMHVFAWNDRFHMLYTAMATQEQGRIQRTGLAVSDDLTTWTKVEQNPVATPDARWYEADMNDSGRADWRDPFAWVEDDVIHGLICAHDPNAPFNRRGCVGHITSRDAVNWEVLPPFYAPGISTDWEVPTMFKLDGRYYLMGHIVAPPIDVYRVANSLEGPWQRPSNDVLLPSNNHAFAPVVWRGKTLLYNWISADFDWHPYASGKSRAIVPPKEAVALPDGQLILKSFEDGWRTLSCAAVSQLPTVKFNSAQGMVFEHMQELFPDHILETTVTMTAHSAGILWRSDESGDQCTRVAVVPGRARIELHKLTRKMNYNAIGRGHVTLQENSISLAPQEAFRLRVVAWGPYIEVSISGRVLLAYLTLSRRSGWLGFFVEDGRATFEDIRITPLAPPEGFEKVNDE